MGKPAPEMGQKRARKLYSYVVKHDSGFAPNPFFGWCTLACCKPDIRRTAVIGDWIVGLTPTQQGKKLVYAMRIKEKLCFQQYWTDRRFKGKKPKFGEGQKVRKYGDNIYRPDKSKPDRFRQLKSEHSGLCGEDKWNKRHDLKGEYVLISKHFVYFGAEARDLPSRFHFLVVGRKHRCNFTAKQIKEFTRWIGSLISRLRPGRHGLPRDWDRGNSSCV